MTTPTESVREWCEFGEHRAYVLMAIARRRFNSELTNNSGVVHRRVLTGPEEIDDQVADLRAIMDRHDYYFRLYLSVNARNTLKGYFNFREQMNGWIKDHVNGDSHAAEKMGRLDSYWKSELHRPEARDDRYFLFDVDDTTEAEAREFMAALPEQDGRTLDRWLTETPNGWHVVTEPFNYTEWEPPHEYDDLDTDGQLFVYDTKTGVGGGDSP